MRAGSGKTTPLQSPPQSEEPFASNYSATQTSQGGLWPDRPCRNARSDVFFAQRAGDAGPSPSRPAAWETPKFPNPLTFVPSHRWAMQPHKAALLPKEPLLGCFLHGRNCSRSKEEERSPHGRGRGRGRSVGMDEPRGGGRAKGPAPLKPAEVLFRWKKCFTVTMEIVCI